METIGSFVRKHDNGNFSKYTKYLVDGKIIFFSEEFDKDNWPVRSSIVLGNMDIICAVEHNDHMRTFVSLKNIFQEESSKLQLIFSNVKVFTEMQSNGFDFVGFSDKESWDEEIYVETEVDFETGDTRVKTDIYRKVSNQIVNGLHFVKENGYRFDNSYSYLDYDEEEECQFWTPFEKEVA